MQRALAVILALAASASAFSAVGLRRPAATVRCQPSRMVLNQKVAEQLNERFDDVRQTVSSPAHAACRRAVRTPVARPHARQRATRTSPHPPAQITSLRARMAVLDEAKAEALAQLAKMQGHLTVLVEKAGDRHGVFDRARDEAARRKEQLGLVLAQLELEMKRQGRLLTELEATQRTLLRQRLFPGNYAV